MKKLVLFSILSILFSTSTTNAQNVTEVDLVIFSDLDAIAETTTIPGSVFGAIKKAASLNHVGKITAIMKSSRFVDSYFIMTSEQKFYSIAYDEGKKTARIELDFDNHLFVMTKENLHKMFGVDLGFIKYVIRNPECRIPNDIPNCKNTLTSEE